MSSFDAFFFDFDGTLGDTEPDIRHSWLSAIRELGLPEDNYDRIFRVGPQIQETAAMLFPELSAERSIDLQNSYKHFYDDALCYQASPYPGVGEMLTALYQSGKLIYVVTNKRYKPLYKLMEKFNFFRCCHGIFSPDIVDCENHLKKPDLLKLAIRISGVSPEKALMVGDTELDIAAGKANNAGTCAVTWGYASRECLQQSKPDIIIDSPDELLGF